MNYRDFKRNSGTPLLVKIVILGVVLYLTYLLLRIFAFFLAAIFFLLKLVLPVAIFGAVLYLLARFLFGYDIFHGQRRLP